MAAPRPPPNTPPMIAPVAPPTIAPPTGSCAAASCIGIARAIASKAEIPTARIIPITPLLDSSIEMRPNRGGGLHERQRLPSYFNIQRGNPCYTFIQGTSTTASGRAVAEGTCAGAISTVMRFGRHMSEQFRFCPPPEATASTSAGLRGLASEPLEPPQAGSTVLTSSATPTGRRWPTSTSRMSRDAVNQMDLLP
jgi:hypothetical protein